ncbi:hypothetical protein NE237_005111 [Protea cynaroides]|uniref:Uncharacterized protein n=1 Tax=Protea cynaroides TaxID=273540 RepID=A0A9Q0QU95_9MAGN|nr:hypothetical protein NE237_005111 [Protea cynaroides]
MKLEKMMMGTTWAGLGSIVTRIIFILYVLAILSSTFLGFDTEILVLANEHGESIYVDQLSPIQRTSFQSKQGLHFHRGLPPKISSPSLSSTSDKRGLTWNQMMTGGAQDLVGPRDDSKYALEAEDRPTPWPAILVRYHFCNNTVASSCLPFAGLRISLQISTFLVLVLSDLEFNFSAHCVFDTVEEAHLPGAHGVLSLLLFESSSQCTSGMKWFMLQTWDFASIPSFL